MGAFFNACFQTTLDSARPLMRASLMYSLSSTLSIAERVSRMKDATENHPIATAGRTRFETPPLPDVGNQPSCTAKIQMSTIASQNEGSDCPSRAISFPPVSSMLPFFTADITPIGTASNTDTPIAITASCNVAGRWCSTSSIAVRPCHLKDAPNSPFAAFLTKVKYWMYHGSLRPHRSLMRLKSSSDASGGNSTSSGFPESRAREKTIMLTPMRGKTIGLNESDVSANGF